MKQLRESYNPNIYEIECTIALEAGKRSITSIISDIRAITGVTTIDIIYTDENTEKGRHLIKTNIKIDPSPFTPFNQSSYDQILSDIKRLPNVMGAKFSSEPNIAENLKLKNLIREVIQEKKSKRDRCLRIADRKFDKPSAYKSGAVVRCRKGKIWKGIKEGEESEINYTKPNFEFEWDEAIRYPEFKQMGKEGWIDLAKKGYTTKYSQIKDILGNVDLDFNALKAGKKKRFQDAFEIGIIEVPIAVKFNETDYDLVAGNTRLAGLVDKGIDPLIWVVDLTTPQFLYHATYKPLLKKIKEKGLDTNDSKKAWEDSIPGYVYLALDPYVAESYAEESEMVPEGWLDDIIILKIDTNKLDKSKLFTDQNVQDNEGDTLEYRGVIPWEALSLYKSEQLTEKQKETLRTWFKRKGAPGKTGGWVDCNSPIRKDGKITGYKPCGRQKGEIRSKYPSCRPTPSKCKDPGKGKKWGKTK